MEDAQNKGTLNAEFQPELSQNQRLESEKNADSKICPCDIHVNPSGVRKSKYSPPPSHHGCRRTAKNHNPHQAIQVNVFSSAEQDF
jgi:hypothetical protein